MTELINKHFAALQRDFENAKTDIQKSYIAGNYAATFNMVDELESQKLNIETRLFYNFLMEWVKINVDI